MTTAKSLGIWMDHLNAHLIELTTDPILTTTVQSKFTHESKEQSMGKSENVVHNKEQHQEADYYKKLGEIIIKYDNVILFGPTDAKAELLNILKADHRFDKIKIETQQADKMTENQEHAFVIKYFSFN